ncbi:MAG: TetR/AcrR family transcriptional regulator [Polyangiaceae bacterium]
MSKRMTHAERRAQLIQVGRAVFAKHGYESTSVEEIAREAKVSKPIVYEHFGGKEGLYAIIVDREMDSLYQRISDAIARGSARTRFEQAVLAFLTYVEDEPDGFAVLTRDAPMQMRGRGMPSVISDLGTRVRDIFNEQFKTLGYDAKVAPIYAHALIGMVTLVGQWWGADPKRFKKEVVASHLAAIGWMGLRHLPQKPQRIQ